MRASTYRLAGLAAVTGAPSWSLAVSVRRALIMIPIAATPQATMPIRLSPIPIRPCGGGEPEVEWWLTSYERMTVAAALAARERASRRWGS